jgi:hypothetical protein
VRRKRDPRDVLYVMLCKQCKALGLPEPETEQKFHPDRKWKFDYAWPAVVANRPLYDRDARIQWAGVCEDMEITEKVSLAIEIQGGTYLRGKHSRGAGQANDMEKYNEAQRLGWRVLLFDSNMISSQPKRQKCVDLVLEMLQ